MSTHKLSIAGYLFGAFIVVATFIRYWIIWHDVSQFITFTLVGYLILILAYIYNWMRETDERLRRLQSQADTIGAYVTNNSKLSEIEAMRGEGKSAGL